MAEKSDVPLWFLFGRPVFLSPPPPLPVNSWIVLVLTAFLEPSHFLQAMLDKEHLIARSRGAIYLVNPWQQQSLRKEHLASIFTTCNDEKLEPVESTAWTEPAVANIEDSLCFNGPRVAKGNSAAPLVSIV
ncbi:hypothetical protein NL676_010150 [Syzygium grande]|nr:hypothetical protein NL676_010150 [Syzygium grande]